MAYALRCGRPHRASGDLAYHVLDVMHAFQEASESGKHVHIQSTLHANRLRCRWGCQLAS